MILNKKNFSETQIHLSEVCKVLASPVRIAILEQMAIKEDCVQRELLQIMGLAPTTILTHLQVLKKAGIIKGNVTSGSRLYYSIDWHTLNKFKINFENLHEKIINQQSKCVQNFEECL